jgi:hypothetical protein
VVIEIEDLFAIKSYPMPVFPLKLMQDSTVVFFGKSLELNEPVLTFENLSRKYFGTIVVQHSQIPLKDKILALLVGKHQIFAVVDVGSSEGSEVSLSEKDACDLSIGHSSLDPIPILVLDGHISQEPPLSTVEPQRSRQL